MRGDLNIPEIEKEQEIREKLREEFKNDFALETYPDNEDQAVKGILLKQVWKEEVLDDMADWWLSKLEAYAQEKIDNIFAQEANRGGGMIKVRGGNGVTLMTKEQLEELDKNK